MKTTLWLTTFAMLLSAPLGFSKTELETLRSTVAEQERQIRQLEDENMKLRSLNGQIVKASVEAPARKKASPAAAVPSTPGSEIYTVRAGDTLAKIGRKTGNSAEAIATLNQIKDAKRLRIGQKLKLPAEIAASPATPARAAIPGSATYIVRDGETFYSIARKHKVSADSLVAANPGIKPGELHTGQLIRLVEKSPAAAPSSAPAVQQPEAKSATITNKPATPASEAQPAPKTSVHSVTINGEMTYGEFAAKHGTQIERLNELNGLDLSQNTVLAKGSELYVSAQP